MILWLRTRHVAVLVGAGAATAALGLLIGHTRVSAASFVGGAEPVTMATFLPIIWAAAWADVFAARIQAVEARPVVLPRLGVGRQALLDVGLFVVGTLVADLTLGWFAPQDGAAYGGVGRVLVLAGMTTAVTLRKGPGLAVYLSCFLLLFTTVYPGNAPGAGFIRILQADGVTWWTLSIGAGLAGFSCWCLLLDRVQIRLSAADSLD